MLAFPKTTSVISPELAKEHGVSGLVVRKRLSKHNPGSTKGTPVRYHIPVRFKQKS
ncbi:MAG: hypothetical protein ACPF83_12230 [Flavobacteriales bacterium]